MEKLLEDYKRKQKTIREMIADNDVTQETLNRLKIKQGMINSFIVDIHAAMADNLLEAKAALPLQNVSISLPNDEQIKQWANSKEKVEDFMPTTLKTHITKKIECRIEGAKWMRDLLRQ